MLEHFFSGKRILFIAPKFFGYEKEILKRLTDCGAIVDFYDDRPSTNNFFKVSLRIFPFLVRNQVVQYFSKIVSGCMNNYDYVFIIKLECFPSFLLKKLRSKLTSAKFIYYSYDSIVNNKNYLDSAGFFDQAFTFDGEDSTKFRSLKLRPLFYLNEYSQLPDEPCIYDLSFVGSVHSDRFAIFNKIKKDCVSKYTIFGFLFIPARWIYYIKRIFLPSFWHTSIKDFQFSSLNKVEVMKLIAQSKIILDFQHPAQTGLTMRTIEMIGARKKMVTTNSFIRKYDFYRSQNICIVDREQPCIPSDFFTSEYVQLPTDIYDKYSLDGWLLDVFCIKDTEHNQCEF